MRFTFKLYSRKPNPVVSFNFHESFSKGITNILQSRSADYETLMASEEGHKPDMLTGFKDFSFSEIHCQFVSKEGRMCVAGDDIRITVSFQLPQKASGFIREIFLNQRFTIGDEQWHAMFTIAEIYPFRYFLRDSVQDIKVITASPVVAELKKPDGGITFIGPAHPEFSGVLLSNWREKYKRIYGSSQSLLDFLPCEIKPVLQIDSRLKVRAITVKNGDEKITVRGHMNFYLQLTGTKAALQLILNTGIASYNHFGLGCITTIFDQKPRQELRQKKSNYSKPTSKATEDITSEISTIFKKFSK